MKRFILAGLAAVALSASAPAAGSAQVRVSVNVGLHPRGYVYRTYTPRAYYARSYHDYNYNYRPVYRSSYRGYYARPRVEVVRVYRPAPVVIYRQRNHRVYRHR